MQHNNLKDNSMHVPNWLIAIELGAGAALLYISSSALVNTDMHISRNVARPTVVEELQSAPSASSEEKIILSAHSGTTLYIK